MQGATCVACRSKSRLRMVWWRRAHWPPKPPRSTRPKPSRLMAPQRVGEHAWSIVFPAHEFEGVLHEQSTLSMSVRTRPHATSLAVWAIPSPCGDGRTVQNQGGRRSLRPGAISTPMKSRSATRPAPSWPAQASGKHRGRGRAHCSRTDVELLAPAEAGMFSVVGEVCGIELGYLTTERPPTSVSRSSSHRSTG